MNLPEELKYTKDHEWVRLEDEKTDDGKSVATIGITDFAQNELGDIVYVEIETVGDELNQGDVFGTVEAVKTVSDLFMPVSGIILEKNEELVKLARHNFKILDQKNISCRISSAQHFLNNNSVPADLIYLDPSRRVQFR